MKKKATTKILTRDDKEVEIDADSIINFPDGFPGFEASKRFKIFHPDDKPSNDSIHPVYWLQSLDETDVVFSISDPVRMGVQYHISLSDKEMKALDLRDDNKSWENVAIFMILARISEDEAKENPLFQFIGTRVKPNLTAPVLINLKKRIGLQKVLQQVNYTLNIQGA